MSASPPAGMPTAVFYRDRFRAAFEKNGGARTAGWGKDWVAPKKDERPVRQGAPSVLATLGKRRTTRGKVT